MKGTHLVIIFLVLIAILFAIATVFAGMLLVPRLRSVAAIGVIALMGVLESAAREFFFGALMISLALLYPRRDLLTPGLPIFAAALAFLLAAGAGWLPGFSFG